MMVGVLSVSPARILRALLSCGVRCRQGVLACGKVTAIEGPEAVQPTSFQLQWRSGHDSVVIDDVGDLGPELQLRTSTCEHRHRQQVCRCVRHVEDVLHKETIRYLVSDDDGVSNRL